MAWAARPAVATMQNVAQTLEPDELQIATQAQGCNDVQFVFARGSGEQLGDRSATAWRTALAETLTDSTLRYSFYELGSAVQEGFQYPAVAVSGSADGFGNLLGAYISGGESFRFGESVAIGSSELKAYIAKVSQACPATKFVLGGYSQGAMLISRVLSQLPAERILYVATFGDPKLYLPEGKGVPSAACLGRHYSNYRIYVPDCQAYEGVLGSYRPYQPADFVDKLGVWCNAKDIMCSSGMSISDHTAYTSTGLYQSAAQVIRGKLTAAFPEQFLTDKTEATPAQHNLAILIDSTQSMAPMINSYRKEAKRLAEQVLANNGQVALYEFRDLDDPFVPVQLCAFGCTLEEFSQKLDQIEVGGGGDDPESALSAIMTAMNELKWQPGATKSIVLLTDESYLSPDRDGVTLAEVVQRSLEIDPVNVYPITSPKWVTFYQELAEATNGQVFNIRQGLQASTEAILGRPVAILPQPFYYAEPGQTLTFDASASYTTGAGPLRFDWDLDGDGEFEAQDVPARLEYTYQTTGQQFIQVRVTDGHGHASTMSAQVVIQPTMTKRSATVAQLSAIMLDKTNAKVDFKTDAQYLLVSLDETVLGFIDPHQDSFVLQDIHPGATLTLTPYNAEQERGTARSIQIVSTALSTPGASSAPDAPDVPIVPNGPIVSNVLDAPNVPVVPGVPNTGISR